jgi:hypothetical protein
MTALIIGAAVLGAALGRPFEFLILAPLTATIALIIFLELPFWPHSALPKAIQFDEGSPRDLRGFGSCERQFWRREPGPRRLNRVLHGQLIREKPNRHP